MESEDGVKCSEYANYAMPQDIQDLAAGEDPYKLMDLMVSVCDLVTMNTRHTGEH